MTSKIWGGRFQSATDAVLEAINVSIDFDKRLGLQDVRGSLAHVAMLAETGIVSRDDAAKIAEGLARVKEDIENKRFEFSRTLEDIHMNVESRLAELIGPAAGRLHTARSRNDQVATDFRLYIRDEIDALDRELADLQTALATRALEEAASVMPGFTHLQSAQPVTFGHHLLAYVEMIARDRSRLRDARARLNECPLGAAALAGTSFPIDRTMTAQALGFDRPTANSLDSVSDRDFVLETLSAAAICATHLSRFAEEIVLWTTPQFGFIALSDKFTTGSSIMPQKRNPDVFELLRARSAQASADLLAVLNVPVKLTSGYHRDLQLIKAPLFRMADAASACTGILTHALSGVRFDPERCAAAMDPSLYATEEACKLVLEDGLPFRDAYQRIAARYGQSK